jgi:hypothetical protein
LPPALLFAALGLALAFSDRKRLPLMMLITAAIAAPVSFVPFSHSWADGLFLGCWASVLLAGVVVHLPGGVGPRLAAILALDVGFWGGAVIAVAGHPLDLAISLPWVALAYPGAWLVKSKWQIAVKVLASWLIAVALLSATLQITTPTPGYVPDHMD